MKVFCAAAAVLTVATLGFAQSDQDVRDAMRRLEEQNREILGRLHASEKKNEEMARELESLKAEQVVTNDSTRLESSINSIVADDSGVTWSKLTKSGNPIQIYGYVRLDAYWDQARANSVHVPTFILPEDTAQADGNDDEFAFDSRLTRIGFNIDAGQIGDAKTTAKLETDFANTNNPSESRETPRIRLAYINLDFGNVTLRFGQDWDILAPLFPAINYETLMWNAGNLGDRRPQAMLIWQPTKGEATEFEVKLGAGLTGAVDNLDLDTGVAGAPTVGQRDGFDSGLPHGQMRLGLLTEGWVEKKKINLGLWGAIGELETDTEFAGEDCFTTFTIGLDITLPITSSLGMKGEFFYGEALADFRGGIGQSVNTALGEEIESVGGWGEFYWDVTDTWRLHIGGTIDDPTDDDVPANGRELNWSMYVGTVYQFGGGLKAGMDVIYWETQFDTLGIGNTIRLNFWIQLDF